MQALKILAAGAAGVVALILAIGAMLPETEASKARALCDNLARTAYTAAERAQSDEVCAVLRKEADRRMGRLPAGAP